MAAATAAVVLEAQNFSVGASEHVVKVVVEALLFLKITNMLE